MTSSAVIAPSVHDSSGDVVTPVQCELLCFIKDKCQLMTFDDIAKICTDFYSEDEIVSAKTLVDLKLSYRLPRRQGSNKCRSTVEDLIKACLDPNESLPAYYAVDLSRLPPVDASHCDMSAILAELQSLRSEVRAINRINDEVSELRQEVMKLQQLKSVVDGLQKNIMEMDFPPLLQTEGSSSRLQLSSSNDTAATFVSHARELKSSGISEDSSKRQQRLKPAVRTVIGTSSNNQHITSVKTYRTVDVFVSRLHPNTAKEELIDCVNSVKDSLQIDGIACTKLKPRYEHLYSSFYVAIRVDALDIKKAIDLFLSADSWPSGVLVRRYFAPKNG